MTPAAVALSGRIVPFWRTRRSRPRLTCDKCPRISRNGRRWGCPGRRLLRRRSQQLSEAGRVLREGTGKPASAGWLRCRRNRHSGGQDHGRRACRTACRRRQDPAATEVSGAAAQPLLGRRQREILFLDESGQSLPRPDLAYDYFALAGVSMTPLVADRYRDAAAVLNRSSACPSPSCSMNRRCGLARASGASTGTAGSRSNSTMP